VKLLPWIQRPVRATPGIRLTISDLIRRDGREPGGGRPRVKYEISFDLCIPKHMLERIKRITLPSYTETAMWINDPRRKAIVELRKQISRRFPVQNFTLIGPWNRHE